MTPTEQAAHDAWASAGEEREEPRAVYPRTRVIHLYIDANPEARAALALTEAKVAALDATAEASGHRPGRVRQALAHWRKKRAEAAYWIARIEAGDTLDPTGEIEPLRAEVARLEAEVRIADAKRAEAERKTRPVRPEHVENIEAQLAGLARNNRALREELAAIKGMLGVGCEK